MAEIGLLWGRARQLYDGVTGVIGRVDFPEKGVKEVRDRKSSLRYM